MFDLTGQEIALLWDLQRRSARGERALLMGNADRRPLLRLVELGYADHQIVSSGNTAICWITSQGMEVVDTISQRPR